VKKQVWMHSKPQRVDNSGMINDDAGGDVDVDDLTMTMSKDDEGVCLSLHQPWASLCIAGIKRYEGRNWNTSYRGRLWIASTIRVATAEEIEQLETQYREVYHDTSNIPFPSTYPPSALLGCCELVNVLSNNGYDSEFQRHRRIELAKGLAIEDSESRYVYQLESPHALILPPRVSGQHKLWKLDSELLNNVQQQLKPVSSKWRVAVAENIRAEKRAKDKKTKRQNATADVPLKPLNK